MLAVQWWLGILARDPLVKWSSPWTIVMIAVLVIMVISGSWTGAVAAGKGRSMQWWFIIGFFLPVIGVIAIYIVKRIPTAATPAKK
jgi:hypothetical protein